MRALIALAVGVVAFVLPASAQETSATWQRVIDVQERGEIRQIQLAPNGDIVVAGFIPKPGKPVVRFLSDAWVARYSLDGRELWSRTVGGYQRDEALALALGKDGSIVIAGWRDVSEAHANNGFAAKFSAAGELQWETLVTGASRRQSIESVAITDSGDVLLGGRDSFTGDTGSRPLLLRLNGDGEILWKVNLGPEPVTVEAAVAGRTMRVTSPYRSAAVGAVRPDGKLEALTNDIDFDKGKSSACIVVSLEDGKETGDACAEASKEGYLPGQAYAFTTWRAGIYEDDDVNLRRFDATGSVIWEQAFPTEWGDGFNAVAAAPDGSAIGAGYIIVGPQVRRDNWDGLVMKVDADGKEVWRRVLGGSRRDELTGVTVLPDGSIIVAGYTGSQGGAEDWNPWIMRLNANGELEGEALKDLQNHQK